MTSLATHKIFYTQTTALAQEIKAIENEIKSKEQDLLSLIENVISEIKRARDIHTDASSAVARLVDKSLDNISHVISEWEHKVKSYENGLEFREKLGDSLLVFVYGKVKAGKSSLGNYMVTGRSKPDPAWFKRLSKELHSPHFFYEELNEEFNEDIDYSNGFRVGERETTSCIQGFKVPGMTWIDSPGLHSVNGKNGQLAEKYVDSADLIIYPMNSAQPGRETDLKELNTLLRNGKRILILITRSDKTETDIDDETGKIFHTLVMKSQKDRNDQESHIENELQKLCKTVGLENIDTSALTVSVAYAEENKNSDEAMNASGMMSLFNKLAKIINSEGIELKKIVPKTNLNAFYNLLLSDDSSIGITRLILPIKSGINAIEKQKFELDKLTENALAMIKLAFVGEVDKNVERYAENRDIRALNQALEQYIELAIDKNFRPKLNELCQKALDALTELPTEMTLCDGLSFKDQKVKVKIDKTKQNQAIGTGTGAVLGGAIGFVFGGPLGASIGSTIGGALGNQGGKFFDAPEEVEVNVGDNREEIKDAVLKQGDILIDKKLSLLKSQALSSVFSPIEDALSAVNHQILSLQRYIEGQLKNV